MGVHEDLLAAAAGLAEAAKTAPNREYACTLVNGAKTALEAAALAESVSDGEIAQVLAELQDELAAAGLLEVSVALEPGEFLKGVLVEVRRLQQAAALAEGRAAGYEELRAQLARMADQFAAAGTWTAVRNAERMRAMLDQADETLATG